MQRFEGPWKDDALAGQGRVGVVLANGPSLDELPDEFFEAARNSRVVSLTLNSGCVCERLRRAEFLPNLYYHWDPPRWQSPRVEDLKAFDLLKWRAIEAWQGKVWRLAETTGQRPFPYDQLIQAAMGFVWRGAGYAEGPWAMYQANNSGDCAVHLLARLGIEEVWVSGVDLNPAGGHSVDGRPADGHGAWTDEQKCARAVDAWRELRKVRPSLALYSLSAGSRLVTEGVVEHRTAAAFCRRVWGDDDARESQIPERCAGVSFA